MLSLGDHPRLFDAFLVFPRVAFDFLPGTVAEHSTAAAKAAPESSHAVALDQFDVVLHERMFALCDESCV